MEFFKNLKSSFATNTKFFENYIKISLLLNAFTIILSALYELIFAFSYFGQIVGSIFLLTFFYNLGLIVLNGRIEINQFKIRRKIQFLGYLYLIFAVITVLTLISLGLAGIKRQKFDPFYYVLFYFGFFISYLDYKKLKINENETENRVINMEKMERRMKLILFTFLIIIMIFTGLYGFNLLSGNAIQNLNLILSYVLPSLLITIIFLIPIILFLLLKITWRRSNLLLTTIGFLKIILISLCLLLFFISGLFVFNILTFGIPLHVIFYLINFIFPAFFSILILIVPVGTLLLYKSLPTKLRKIRKSITIIGLFLTISLALPLLTTPLTVVDANHQFAETFGKNWNKFDSRVDEHFLDMPHVLIHSWFGEPDLEPDSWKLDAKNVYKETDDYKLKYDVYYPGKIAAQFIGKKSTVIFIHGGGWSAREREDGAHYLKYLAAQGYVCFTIDYRLLERDGSPDKSFVGDYNIENMMGDIANFTQYLAAKELEDEIHGADLDNVFIIGQSAGAHLAGVTGFGYNDDEWGLDQRLKIKGIVLFYPPNDAERFFYGNALYDAGISKYKTPDEDPGFYDLYTPSELVDNDDPPCLIFQGTSDTYVPYENAVEIKKACEKKDVDIILITSYFMGHAHDISVLVKTMALYYMERFFYLIKED
jgi:acetyl esterase/lipase